MTPRDLDFWRGWLEPSRDFFNPRRKDRILNSPLWDNDFGSGSDFFNGALSTGIQMEEENDHYLLSFEMPGISKEHIDIQVRGNQLFVTGERSDGRQEKRRYFRSVTLPMDVDPEKVEANYKDGILQVAIPRAESHRTKKIAIGEGGFFSKLVGKVEQAIGGKGTAKPKESESEFSHRREAAGRRDTPEVETHSSSESKPRTSGGKAA